MPWKHKFVSDLKWVLLHVLATVVATAIVWEAKSIMDINARLTKIEATLQFHMEGRGFAVEQP